MDAWLSESLDNYSISSDTSMCWWRSVGGGAESRYKLTGSLGMGTSPMSLVLIGTFCFLRAQIYTIDIPFWVDYSCKV